MKGDHPSSMVTTSRELECIPLAVVQQIMFLPAKHAVNRTMWLRHFATNNIWEFSREKGFMDISITHSQNMYECCKTKNKISLLGVYCWVYLYLGWFKMISKGLVTGIVYYLMRCCSPPSSTHQSCAVTSMARSCVARWQRCRGEGRTPSFSIGKYWNILGNYVLLYFISGWTIIRT